MLRDKILPRKIFLIFEFEFLIEFLFYLNPHNIIFMPEPFVFLL